METIYVGYGAVACFLIYVGWGALLQVTPGSDFGGFHRSAAAFVHSGDLHSLYATKSTTTILVYSAFFLVLGTGKVVTWMAAGTLWAVQLPLLYRSLEGFELQPRTSAIATAMYRLAPGTVFFAPIFSSEAVFNLLLILALFAVMKFRATAKLGWVVLTSVACGLLFLTRANGALLFAPLGILSVVIARRKSLAIPTACAALALPFLLVAFAQGVLSYQVAGQVSVLPSKWGSYNLLAGTNRASGGGWNREDLRLAGFRGPNRVSFKEASANARRIALERVSSDPAGFLYFALTKKVKKMWRADTHGLSLSSAGSPHKKRIRQSAPYNAAIAIADGYYIVVLATAALFFLGVTYRPSRIAMCGDLRIVLAAQIVLIAFLHIVVETKTRYHVPLMPAIYIISGWTLSQLLAPVVYGKSVEAGSARISSTEKLRPKN